MARYRAYGQQTVFDVLFRERVVRKKTSLLQEIGKYLDFEIFRPVLEGLFYDSGMGPCRYDVVLMWKIVMLQKWYGLSDPGVEEEISDRLSFREFLGLSLNDAIPDETSICLFRKVLRETESYDWLFEILNQELEKRDVKVKGGSMVDATFIEAPKGKRKDGSKTDPDADYGHKGHGYSMHNNVGEQDKLIHDLAVTSARPHDSQHFEDVMVGDETKIWADSAYRSEEREKTLQEEKIESYILEKAQRNKPLTPEQKASNKDKSKVRARVEHPHAQLKEHQKFRRTRYYGLAANRCDTFLHAIAYNLRRGVFLLKQQVQKVVADMKKNLEPQLEDTGLQTA